MRLPPALAAGLVVAGLVAVAAAQDETTIARRRALAARVARLRGETGAGPSVRSADGTRPLTEGTALRAGDEVTAGKTPVELLFPQDEAGAADRSVDGGDRLVLGPGARATVAPLDTTVDVRLESGDAVARTVGDLRVQAGDAVVVVRGGDAAIDVAKDGVRVDVLGGKVDVEGRTVARGVAPGERVDVDARGTRVRRAAPKAPKWLEEHDAVPPRAIVFLERFATWPAPSTGVPGAPWGEAFPPESPATVGSTGPGDPTSGFAAEVHFGYGSTGRREGLLHVKPATRLRLRYRLSAPAQLQVRIRDGPRDTPYASGYVAGRAQVWTDLELRPARFAVGNGPPGEEFGEANVTYIDICAGEKGATLRLELQHVLAFE